MRKKMPRINVTEITATYPAKTLGDGFSMVASAKKSPTDNEGQAGHNANAVDDSTAPLARASRSLSNTSRVRAPLIGAN
jgi:hypothetical protein